jgi:hypothetical protein
MLSNVYAADLLASGAAPCRWGVELRAAPPQMVLVAAGCFLSTCGYRSGTWRYRDDSWSARASYTRPHRADWGWCWRGWRPWWFGESPTLRWSRYRRIDAVEARAI